MTSIATIIASQNEARQARNAAAMRSVAGLTSGPATMADAIDAMYGDDPTPTYYECYRGHAHCTRH